jgi:hypothetical protein
MMRTIWKAALLLVLLTGCGGAARRQRPMSEPKRDSFGADLTFMRRHTEVVVLRSPDGMAQVAVAPGYQGRVMTSTSEGLDGPSYGYVHYPGVAAGVRTPHMTVLGGEDRFWLGPEAGQYALYFAPGAPFDIEHWQVPEPIDWGAWPITAQSEREVSFAQTVTLTNYAGTHFHARIERTIRLLDAAAIAAALGGEPGPNTRAVAFESQNRLINTGSDAWRKEQGLLSIWVLGMFRPAPRATVVLPFQPGSEAERGPIVNDVYFGPVRQERLQVGERAVFFRADGQARGKIGLSKQRARPIAGSYDPAAGLLTLVQFTPPAPDSEYVNSLWQLQDEPYAGDVVNSYNDGPASPGAAPFGPFYELETSSPAAALAPQAAIEHVHRTLHLRGPEAELDAYARALLGVSLAEVTAGLPPSP